MIAGNYIGVDATGTQAGYGNGQHGIAVQDADGNTLGGTLTADRNLISGNAWDGILISGQSAWNNQVLGNRIGTDTSGAVAIGNGSNGVQLDAAPMRTRSTAET